MAQEIFNKLDEVLVNAGVCDIDNAVDNLSKEITPQELLEYFKEKKEDYNTTLINDIMSGYYDSDELYNGYEVMCGNDIPIRPSLYNYIEGVYYSYNDITFNGLAFTLIYFAIILDKINNMGDFKILDSISFSEEIKKVDNASMIELINSLVSSKNDENHTSTCSKITCVVNEVKHRIAEHSAKHELDTVNKLFSLVNSKSEAKFYNYISGFDKQKIAKMASSILENGTPIDSEFAKGLNIYEQYYILKFIL